MKIPSDAFFLLPPPVIFITVLVTVAAVALLVESLVAPLMAGKRRDALSRINTGVLSVSGALFGLSMTFLANSVWTTRDEARESVNAEARAIRVMDIYLESLTVSSRDGFTRLLTDYGKAVKEEWDDMAEEGAGSPAELALRSIYAVVVRGFAEGDQNRMLQQRLLGALDSMSIARQQRLSIAQNYVSITQWILVTGLGMVLLFVVTASHANALLARRVAVIAITNPISIKLFVILLNDRPFIGYDAQSPQPILQAIAELP